ncbi:MAG: sigma-54-dependent Fis family transcriptional regulator [Rhizobiales bacterium]|nr:sigma-54-dependent Fis family transcriptional regulator [Hyphomicrobiales bacterium]
MASRSRAERPVDVFIVDADPSQRRTLTGLISERAAGRFQARAYASPAEALAARGDRGEAIFIADLDTIGGADKLSGVARREVPLIATSAGGSVAAAIAAVKAGAIDYLPKPIGARALMERLEAALASLEPAAPSAATPTPSPRPSAASPAPISGRAFAGFVGTSPAMRAVYDQIARMAPSRAPIFITGESGTGKELCAEAIHAHSGAGERPFVAINCSAIPKELMESEIFGHVRGAFTGASENRTGAAELADGGTLFLDEIGEMDLALQAKLLRFVQSGTIRRVGGTETRQVDVRLVAATNRDPFAEVEAGRFRADLFYRLHVLPIHLPPLRERTGDILPLAEAFLARYAREEGRAFRAFDRETVERIASLPWPGNVRQLENVIRRLVVLHDAETVTPGMLPSAIDSGASPIASQGVSGPIPTVIQPYRDQERRIIEEALSAFSGNVSRAAAALQISPATIYRKLQAWGISPSA